MDEPSGSGGAPSIGNSEDDDSILAKSKVLTRQEVLKRRARRLRRLSKCYRDHYWSLMEDVRRKHREYYWMYGKSPFREEEDDVEGRESSVVAGIVDNSLNNVNNNGDNVNSDDKLGLGFGGSFNWCAIEGCKAKAMALTRYCVAHIVHDSKQMLYKKCKAPQTLNRSYSYKPKEGKFIPPLICNKTVVKSTSTIICHRHESDVIKHINNVLKRGGASAALSTKIASKFHFHLVIKEFVHHIQSRRRAMASRNINNLAVSNGSD